MNPLVISTQRINKRPDIKKMSSGLNGKKTNSFFPVYPNTTKSLKSIQLNYHQNDPKRQTMKHQTNSSSYSYGKYNSLFSNYYTHRESSAGNTNCLTKSKLSHQKDTTTKQISSKIDIVNNSVISDLNYKEIIKAKEQEIHQLKNELKKVKHLLAESQKKNKANKSKGQASFDFDFNNDKTYLFSKTTDSQEQSILFPFNPLPQTQVSVGQIVSASEQLNKESDAKRNQGQISSSYHKSRINHHSSIDIKTSLALIKQRIQRILDQKFNSFNINKIKVK